MVDSPAPGVGDEQPPPDRQFVTRKGRDGRLVTRNHGVGVVEQFDPHVDRPRRRGPVAHHRRDRDDGASVVDLGRTNLDAVGCEVQRAGAEQPHVPVDPGPAVPPGIIAGSNRHHDLVPGIETKEMIDRHVEGRVAGWPVSGGRTVHRHDGVAIHTFEQQEERVARLLGRDVERSPVLPRAGREVAGRRRCRRRAIGTDHRIVRQRHRRPLRGAAHHLGVAADLRAVFPAVVERCPDHVNPSCCSTAHHVRMAFDSMVTLPFHGGLHRRHTTSRFSATSSDGTPRGSVSRAASDVSSHR